MHLCAEEGGPDGSLEVLVTQRRAAFVRKEIARFCTPDSCHLLNAFGFSWFKPEIRVTAR